MSRFSTKKVGGHLFELTDLTITNKEVMCLGYKAILRVNGNYLCEVERKDGEITFMDGIQGFQKTIEDIDKQFAEKRLRWSYKGNGITYNVAFIVNMIAVRMIDNAQITTAETSELAMRYERERCKSAELEHRCRELENGLCRLTDKIRSMQVQRAVNRNY